MDRRAFLETSGYTAFAAGLGHAACMPAGATARLDRIGVQLYTVRGEMAKNVEGTLDRVAQIGYEEVEFAGYFDRSAEQIRDALRASGLDAPASHIAFDFLDDRWTGHLEAAKLIGHRYLVVGSIPRAQRQSIDGYKRSAERFNWAGDRAREVGIRFGYHNHDFEFEPVDGETPYDVLLAETDPTLVEFELDLFWITKGGRDPLAYFGNHPGRFPLVHVKDMGTNGEMVRVGAGTIDFPSIFMHQADAGIRHFFVEHDNPPDPFASITSSREYLEQLRF